jgi:hypothetical protein
LDYYTSGGTAGCPALLVEPQAQNLVLRSQDFSATWAVAASATVTGITSPDGTPNATTFIADSTINRIRQTITLTSGTTYNFSLFGKFGALSSGFTMNVFQENATTYGSGVCQAFNLNEGTLGASGSVGDGFTLQSVGMENYGDGWYRCRMTVLMSYTPPTLARVGFRIGTQISGGIPLSVVSGSVSAWGAQLETGSIATSYIPTTAAQVTRNAEVINLSGAVSGCIGQTEGTLYAEIIASPSGTGSNLFVIGDGTSSNYVFIGKTSAKLDSFARVSGTTVFSNSTFDLTGNAIKVALAYKSGDNALYVNGNLVASGTTAFTFTSGLIRTGFASGFNFAAPTTVNKFNAAALYTTRLTNAELAALTT